MPEVTVVMPVYNCKDKVANAVKSILSQTFTDFELIIVNDGSTDGVSGILEEYKKEDGRVVIISQANKGLSYSINQALQISKGKYVVRQDADDVSLPERIEKQLEFIKKNNIDILGSYAYLVNEKGAVIEDIVRPCIYEDIVRNLERENCILHPTLMFKRQAVISIGGYSENYEFAQDYELYLKAVRGGLRLGCIPEFLVKITHSASSVSVKLRRKQLLYALSAQAMYFAKQKEFRFYYIGCIFNHIFKILIPMWARKLRVWLRNRQTEK